MIIPFFSRVNSFGNINKKDYIGFINSVQSIFPDLYPKPNSLLYKLALKQLQKSFISSNKRPSIPKWVCGNLKEDDIREQFNLDLIYNFPSKRELNTSLSLSEIVNSSQEILFPPDNCLYETSSLPGSVGYTLCEVTLNELDYDIDTIDWANSFYPVSESAAIISSAEISTAQATDNSLSGGGKWRYGGDNVNGEAMYYWDSGDANDGIGPNSRGSATLYNHEYIKTHPNGPINT